MSDWIGEGSSVSGSGTTGTPLSTLRDSIKEIIQDAAYTDTLLTGRINAAVSAIAAGIRMPDGQISPPLPDLFKYDVVNTSITLPYVSLPTDYQRKVIKIYDSSSYLISPPAGGDYYSFAKFLSRLNKLDMTETGSIYQVAIKGTKLYYQGIPSASTTIGLHYYRKPTILAGDSDVPEGIPEHLTGDLIKHWVIKELYGETIEAGVTEPSRGMEYHTRKFYEQMINLADFIGIDATPEFYGTDSGGEDGGVCD